MKSETQDNEVRHTSSKSKSQWKKLFLKRIFDKQLLRDNTNFEFKGG